MMQKELDNAKRREFDFNGIYSSGEMEAQIQFKNQEIAEFKQKLEQERASHHEVLTELRE